MSGDSSDRIVTDDGLEYQGLILGWSNDYSLHHHAHIASATRPSFYPMSTGYSLPGVKKAGA
jgi:hypothetical protein